MIDLKNTYIENDKGELRDLYIKSCGLSIEEYKETPLYRGDYGGKFISNGGRGYLGFGSEIFCIERGFRKIVLADLKPRTKVEYVKCEFDHKWEAVKFMEETEESLYINPNDEYIEVMVCESAIKKMRQGVTLYRRVEREVEWYEDIPNGGVLCANPNEGLSVVTSYSNGVSNPFECENGDTWTSVTPLTSKEIQSLLDNAPQ